MSYALVNKPTIRFRPADGPPISELSTYFITQENEMARISQIQHDQLVQSAVNSLTAKNFTDIRADIPGYMQPTRITWTQTGRGHIPDITAQNSREHVFEAETADSIFDQHTEDQWKLFAAYAQQHSAEFWVIVPAGSESDAQTRLNQLGLQAQVWEI